MSTVDIRPTTNILPLSKAKITNSNKSGHLHFFL